MHAAPALDCHCSHAEALVMIAHMRSLSWFGLSMPAASQMHCWQQCSCNTPTQHCSNDAAATATLLMTMMCLHGQSEHVHSTSVTAQVAFWEVKTQYFCGACESSMILPNSCISLQRPGNCLCQRVQTTCCSCMAQGNLFPSKRQYIHCASSLLYLP